MQGAEQAQHALVAVMQVQPLGDGEERDDVEAGRIGRCRCSLPCSRLDRWLPWRRGERVGSRLRRRGLCSTLLDEALEPALEHNVALHKVDAVVALAGPSCRRRLPAVVDEQRVNVDPDDASCTEQAEGVECNLAAVGANVEERFAPKEGRVEEGESAVERRRRCD